jgi:ubiquitin-protein ligase
VNSTAQLRRKADIELIAQLVKRANGLIQLDQSFELGSTELSVKSSLTSNTNRDFPASGSTPIHFVIKFPARYPFEAPVVHVKHKHFHPNVFDNGVVCLGSKWIASESLDLFVARVLRLLTYDPWLVNLGSPANGAAARWYAQALAQFPTHFPTERRHMHPWLYDPRAEKAVIRCPACAQGLRLPTGRHGMVQCPACKLDFETHT